MDDKETIEPEEEIKSEIEQDLKRLENENAPEKFVMIKENPENISSMISETSEEIKDEVIENNESMYDVIIIGAGLSGLYAAYYLIKKCKDLRILIIEGKDRVGGKSCNLPRVNFN